MKKILFVCLGNICRSPLAEGYFRRLVDTEGLTNSFIIDSAGTSDWNLGQPPDSRAVNAAIRDGIDLSMLRARQVEEQDFVEFDYILAMDSENLASLRHLAAAEYHHKLYLMMDFAGDGSELEVPDPYYGGESGFKRVLEMIDQAASGLLRHLRKGNNANTG